MLQANASVRMAQGCAILAALLVGQQTLENMATAARAHRSEPVVPPAVCQTPVAVHTALGLRLGCSDESELASCGAHAFDQLRLNQGRCERTAYGMPAAWFVSLGYRLNVNRAQAEHLQALPHIGAQTARAIVRHRAAHGPFASTEALGAVAGVGPGRVAQLRRFVTTSDGG